MSEVKFASTDEALQHLANITGKKVKVAADLSKELEAVKKFIEDKKYAMFDDLSVHEPDMISAALKTDSVKNVGLNVHSATEELRSSGVKKVVISSVSDMVIVLFKF
jgi:hypothetical protein